tara:strand:+ start:505 stop:720 length:216 start_codon:yes stop_codon:yes gene_type:complete
MRKAFTLLETLTVILIILIMSVFLIPTCYSVYKIFKRMITNEYDEEYYKNDPEANWKKQSDGLFYHKGWEK